MPLPERVLERTESADMSEVHARAQKKVKAKLRGLTYKEAPRAYTSGNYAGLDFEQKMAMLGLGDEVSPEFGRPAWKPTRVIVPEDPFAELEAQRQLWEMEQADEEALDHWRAKLTPAIRAQVESELAARQPVKTEIVSMAPQPIPHRVAPGELKIVRNAVGRIAAAVAPGVSMQVSSRDGNGRIAALSITPDDGEPMRVCVKRDRAGRLIGLAVEDR